MIKTKRERKKKKKEEKQNDWILFEMEYFRSCKLTLVTMTSSRVISSTFRNEILNSAAASSTLACKLTCGRWGSKIGTASAIATNHINVYLIFTKLKILSIYK